MDFLKSAWLWLWSVYKWAGSNAEVEAIWNAAVHSAVIFLAANTFEPSRKWLLAFLGFVVSGAFQAFRNYERNISTAPGTSPNVAAKAALKKAILGMMLVGFMFSMAAPSHAYEWNVPSSVFGVQKLKKLSYTSIPSGLDETDIITLPTAALNVGTVQTSYGLSLSYSIVAARVKGNSGSDTSSLTNYIGLSGSVYGDFGEWLKSAFKTDPRIKAGPGVILPQLCGITPGVQYVWGYHQKPVVAITLNVPFEFLSNSTMRRVCKL